MIWCGVSPKEGRDVPPAEERGAPEAAKNVERFVFAFVLSFPLVSPPQGSLPGVAEVVWCGAFPVAVRWASFAEGDCAPPAKRRAGAETLKCIGRGAVCPAPEGAEQPAKAARAAARQSGGGNPLPAFPAHRASVPCHAPAGAFPRANGVGRAEEPKKSPPPGPCRSASFAPAARQRMAHSSSGTPRPVRADTAHTGRPSRPDSSRASGKRSSSSQKLKTSSTRCCRTCASSSRSTASCRAASVASRTATSRSGTPGDAAERAVDAAAAALDCPAACRRQPGRLWPPGAPGYGQAFAPPSGGLAAVVQAVDAAAERAVDAASAVRDCPATCRKQPGQPESPGAPGHGRGFASLYGGLPSVVQVGDGAGGRDAVGPPDGGPLAAAVLFPETAALSFRCAFAGGASPSAGRLFSHCAGFFVDRDGSAGLSAASSRQPFSTRRVTASSSEEGCAERMPGRSVSITASPSPRSGAPVAVTVTPARLPVAARRPVSSRYSELLPQFGIPKSTARRMSPASVLGFFLPYYAPAEGSMPGRRVCGRSEGGRGHPRGGAGKDRTEGAAPGGDCFCGRRFASRGDRFPVRPPRSNCPAFADRTCGNAA